MRVTLIFLIFFFFSSRRRHTRYWRDWSSDVCSSDLALWCSLCSRPSTHSMVSLHIFTQNGRFFRPRFLVCVVMGSDWLMTYSNTFSDLLQHFHPIDTDVTKMLASDWLLFIAANQKPAFWCRAGYHISHTILLILPGNSQIIT